MDGGVLLGRGTEREEQCLGQADTKFRVVGLPGPQGGVWDSWGGGGPRVEGIPGQER